MLLLLKSTKLVKIKVIYYQVKDQVMKESIQLFVNNVTDERAILFANPYEFDYFFGRARETVNRPREYGFRFIKSFGN